MVYLHALRSWRRASWIEHMAPKMKKIRKNWKWKRSGSEEMVWVIVHEGSPGRRSGKDVGFKLRGKERERELWMSVVVKKRGRSDRWRNRWVWNGGTGTRMRLTERWSLLRRPDETCCFTNSVIIIGVVTNHSINTLQLSTPGSINHWWWIITIVIKLKLHLQRQHYGKVTRSAQASMQTNSPQV